jgi:glycosyltransferase 2 family protein
MAAPPGPSRPSSTRLIVLAGASLLAVLGLWQVLRAGALPFLPPEVNPALVGIGNLVAYSSAWLLVIFLKAWRWRFQLAPVEIIPMRRILSASIVGYAATLLLPFRSGEVVRPALIARNTRVSFLAAVSTSASERIIDAVFASAILLSSLASAEVITPLPDHIGELAIPTRVVTVFGYGAAATSIAAVVAVVLFRAFHDAALSLIRATLGRVWQRAADWVISVLTELARGLAFLTSRHAASFVAVSAAYWIAYCLSAWFLLRVAGFPEVTLAQTGAVVGTLAFGMSLPNAPGFFGTFQIAIYASLALFFPAERVQTHGAVFVFWLYVLQLGWIFALTPLALLAERRIVGFAKAGA